MSPRAPGGAIVDDQDRLHVRGVRQNVGDTVGVLALVDQRDHVRVLEQVAQLALDVAEVHVHQDGARLHDAQHRDHDLDAVAAVQADLVVLLDALIDQVVRKAVGLLLQLCVCQLVVTADQGDTVRHSVDGVLGEVGDIQGHGPQIRTCYIFRQVCRKVDTCERGRQGRSGPDAIIDQRGHTLVLTLNRPEARNALSTEMLSTMVAAWDRVDSDPEIRSCILTGAGGYFCSGMDLKAATAKPPGDSFKDGSYDPSRIDALLKGRRLTKPLIAAVEGPAIAGGTEILQATDIRVAGESAKFGVSEAKWSLYPMGGSAVRLPRQIPYTLAADILLTGRHLTATEAKEMGLIGYVVPDGQALTKALEIAETINRNGPLAVQAILKSIRETEGMPENEAFKIDTQLGIQVFLSDDAKEGPKAFAEKRKPEFKMK